MATNPMNQFEVYKIGPSIEIAGINLSFTNSSLFMLICAILITTLLLFGTREKKLIPSKIQLEETTSFPSFVPESPLLIVVLSLLPLPPLLQLDKIKSNEER